MSLSAADVPRFPISLPLMPFRSVYCLMLGMSVSVARNPKTAMVRYARSCELTGGTLAAASAPSEGGRPRRPPGRSKHSIQPTRMGTGFPSSGMSRTRGGRIGTTARYLFLVIIFIAMSKLCRLERRSPISHHRSLCRSTRD